MNERRARARRITNTGPLASSAWLAGFGLVPRHERWFVEIDLSGVACSFTLEVYAEEWGFQLHHGGCSSWIRVTDVAFVHGRDDHALRARVPRLCEIGAFVRELEARLGVQLDRAAPRIRTNIDGAEATLRAWVAAL